MKMHRQPLPGIEIPGSAVRQKRAETPTRRVRPRTA